MDLISKNNSPNDIYYQLNDLNIIKNMTILLFIHTLWLLFTSTVWISPNYPRFKAARSASWQRHLDQGTNDDHQMGHLNYINNKG